MTGYVSPFLPVGHDGPCHDMRFNQTEDVCQAEYARRSLASLLRDIADEIEKNAPDGNR